MQNIKNHHPHILTANHVLRLLELNSKIIIELLKNNFTDEEISLIKKGDEDKITVLTEYLENSNIETNPKFLVFDDSHPDYNFPDYVETYEYWDIVSKEEYYEKCHESLMTHIDHIVDLRTLMDFLDNLDTKNILVKTMYIIMLAYNRPTIFCTSLIDDVDIIKRMRDLYQPLVITVHSKMKFSEPRHQSHQLCIIFDIPIGKLLMNDLRINFVKTDIRLILKYFREALRCSSYDVVLDWINNSTYYIVYLMKEICIHDNVEIYKQAIKYCKTQYTFVNCEFTRNCYLNDMTNSYELYQMPKSLDKYKPAFAYEEHCLTYESKNIALYIYEILAPNQYFLSRLIRMGYYSIIQHLYENVQSKENFVICFKRGFECIFRLEYVYNFLKYDSTLPENGDWNGNESDFFKSTVLGYINGNCSNSETPIVDHGFNFPIEQRIEICMFLGFNEHFKELVENNLNVMDPIVCANLLIGSIARNNTTCLNIVLKIVKDQNMKLVFDWDQGHMRVFCSDNIKLFVHENKQMIANTVKLFNDKIFDEKFVFEIITRVKDNYGFFEYFFVSQRANSTIQHNVINNVVYLIRAIEHSDDKMVDLIVSDPYIFIENYDVLIIHMRKCRIYDIYDRFTIFMVENNDSNVLTDDDDDDDDNT